MEFGLSKDVLMLIRAVLERTPKVQEAIIFGSRAKGNYRNGSDIDLAIKGERLTFNDILELGIALEEIGLLYKIDLKNYHSITDKDVTDHIDRVGKLFYSKL